ncbi:putative universal stress protein SAUSA300_1656 [Littorina saxatilis]|uniref:putative universal stress protein SAUSA300_1656 n=1 Tax=Littorina saxatilis TaxID=31220 RepID=UPI0038B64C4E
MEHQEDFIVVLAVDNSQHSEFAFNYYTKEVHRPTYKLHVIHCSEAWAHVHVHPMDEGPTPGHVHELKTKEDSKIKEIEDKFSKLMKDNSIDGQFKVVGGKDTWHQIINYQESVKAALIVVGTRGSNAIRRTLMGSVSDSIVHHAHCPVLVCRHS